MSLPFQPPFGAADAADLAIAVAIGTAFGFVLERSGLACARKLVSQFWGTDMAVLKVMFSAIVTAMLGLAVLAGLGVVDVPAIARTAATVSYVGPMIAGGLLLGVGLVVAGYCPGTSLVAAASGRLDALAVVAGVVLGTLGYGEAMGSTSFARLARSGDLGQVFLPEALHLSWQVVAALVTVVAIGCFALAERLERRFGGATNARDRAPRRLVLTGFGALAGAALATLALPAASAAGAPGLRGAGSAEPRAAGTAPAAQAGGTGAGLLPKRRKRCDD